MTSNITIREKVEQVLRDFPETRTDDKMLVARFYMEFHRECLIQTNGVWYMPIGRLLSLTPSDSITRARRKIQQEGNFTTTEHDKKRYAYEVMDREHYKYN